MPAPQPSTAARPASILRVATFNASLSRPAEGRLIEELASGDSGQASAVAGIIQRVRPDVLLINEFDYDAAGTAARLFQADYLGRGQDGAEPISYPYVYQAGVNAGIASGFDLDRSGSAVQQPGAPGYANDAWGFGSFPGQFGMLLLSKFPIVSEEVRTFQHFLWRDMPGALLPDDRASAAPADWYAAPVLARFPLSSKSHWDVPLRIGAEILHILAAHPTPPVFDGAEDRNGRRNHDEIRFWADYVAPGRAAYITDDAGRAGGLGAGTRFIIVGDLNADPLDGDSKDHAVRQLLDHLLINAAFIPHSRGGSEAALSQGGINARHRGDPAADTADFHDRAPGNLRTDYLLPSAAGLTVEGGGVFWPERAVPCFRLIGEPDAARPAHGFASSDHRLVWADVTLTPAAAAAPKAGVTGLSFLGEVEFPTGFVFEGTVVGGLSAITYDAAAGVYYALSDDRSHVNSARFYTLSIDLADGRLDDGDVAFTAVTTLKGRDGAPFPAGSLDPEGIALKPPATLFVASEGDTSAGVPPFVKAFALDGQEQAALALPEKFLPDALGTRGVRNNLALESLTLTPDGHFLYTASENALVQDGPAASLVRGSPARLLKFDAGSGKPVAEFLYRTQPIASAPLGPLGPAGNGLVELLALDSAGTLLALERGYSAGAGITARLFEIETESATDIAAMTALDEPAGVRAVEKRLVFDLGTLGIPLDNLEGMTFGPDLPDGRRSLILVSDNNFNGGQFTQVLAFAVEPEAPPPPAAPLPGEPAPLEEGWLPGCGDLGFDAVPAGGAAEAPAVAGEGPAAPAAVADTGFIL